MICIIALVVFAILAIFSAKYRPLAAEAFDCVFRRVTFRKCTSSLDKRLKSQITGKLLKRNKSLGRWVFKHFEILSWLFLILAVLSLVQLGISGYNFAKYGNCNGPGESGFCPFDPLGNNAPTMSESGICMDPALVQGTVSAPEISELDNNPRTGSASASVAVIEFGCFACPNTAKQAPVIKEMIEHYGTQIHYIYVDFPLPHHEYSFEAAQAAHCVYEQDEMNYWSYYFTIFESQEDLSAENLRSWAGQIGMDMESFDACMRGEESAQWVQRDLDVGIRSGIYGTPSFFINGESYVGYQNFKTLKSYIDSAMEESE